MYRHNDTKHSVGGVLISSLLSRSVRRQAFFGILFACVAAGASVGLVGLAGWFIAASALAGISGGAAFIVAYPSSGIRAFAVTRVVFRYLERLTNHRVTFSLLSRLRVYFFQRALEIRAIRFGEYRSGDLLSRATSDIDSLDNVFPRVVVPTLAALVVCGASVAFLAYLSPLLAVILAIGCLFAGLALPLVSWIAGKSSGSGISRTKSGLRTDVVEAVEGLPEIRSYGAGWIVAERLDSVAEQARYEERRARFTDVLGVSAGSFASQATTFAVLLAGLLLYGWVGLAGPVLALAVLLTTGVFEQLGALPAAYRSLGVTRASANRLDDVFVTRAGITHCGREVEIEGKHPGVELSGVCFGYEGRDRPALDDFSMRVGGGEMVALSGASGSGKTTLLRLVAGELEPDLGSVEIGGVEVREVSARSLSERVAYASQDEHIFDDTLRNNLLISAPEAPNDVLLYVLDIVGLTGFYRGLEHGLDTRVGTHGMEMSGGQRRRLAVARALLRRPDVLLLDEPTGSLDETTAQAMMSGIRENLPDATVIVATHDPDVVRRAVPGVRVLSLP